MNKTYCDICKKEVKHYECYQVKINPVSMSGQGSPNSFYPDVCIDCVKKIRELVIK